METETEIYSNCQENELLSPSMDSGPAAIRAKFMDCLQVFLDSVASLVLKCVSKSQAGRLTHSLTNTQAFLLADRGVSTASNRHLALLRTNNSLPTNFPFFRLIRNKCFGSVFNSTTTAVFIIIGRVGDIFSFYLVINICVEKLRKPFQVFLI